jgi:two-component system nitrate/nitrite response regulator NarL
MTGTGVGAMAHIRLFLVDGSQLFRDGLKRLLECHDCTVVGQAPSLGHAAALLASGVAADLLVFDPVHEEDGTAEMKALRSAWPELKLVVLTASGARQTLAQAIECAVDSYLLKDMAPEALARSFQLIMLGQQIFPTRLMMSMMRDGAEADAGQPALRATSGLSPRELQILRLLVNGESNKAIARELAITEATVKVHLKALLRKVRVNNRTQAAVWAINQGLDRGAASEQPSAAAVDLASRRRSTSG